VIVYSNVYVNSRVWVDDPTVHCLEHRGGSRGRGGGGGAPPKFGKKLFFHTKSPNNFLFWQFSYVQIFGRTILKKVLLMSCPKMFTQSYHRVYKKAASRSIEHLIFRKKFKYPHRLMDISLINICWLISA
jgi:hypothetical protein